MFPDIETTLVPVKLSANRPTARFYQGGSRIAAFRGGIEDEPYTPEDWVGSTVTVRGEEGSGLTVLPDGRLLREAIAADPIGWLGQEHVTAFGADPMLLVKLLDAGQRLPVHAHPDADFAARTLGTAHGKAEAWYILTPGTVYLGLVEEIAPAHLADLVAEQRVEEMLGMLHPIDVVPGDRVFVPAGMLHAVGEGVFLVEVQEPEDLSILLEWRDFELDGATDGHLGVGFDVALEAVDTTALDTAARDALVVRADSAERGLCVPAEAYFRLDQLMVDGTELLDEGFSVLVVLDGEATLRGQGAELSLPAGSTALLPAALRAPRLTGTATVLIARPPRPR